MSVIEPSSVILSQTKCCKNVKYDATKSKKKSYTQKEWLNRPKTITISINFKYGKLCQCLLIQPRIQQKIL